jgi:hypothetical protein
MQNVQVKGRTELAFPSQFQFQPISGVVWTDPEIHQKHPKEDEDGSESKDSRLCLVQRCLIGLQRLQGDIRAMGWIEGITEMCWGPEEYQQELRGGRIKVSSGAQLGLNPAERERITQPQTQKPGRYTRMDKQLKDGMKLGNPQPPEAPSPNLNPFPHTHRTIPERNTEGCQISRD